MSFGGSSLNSGKVNLLCVIFRTRTVCDVPHSHGFAGVEVHHLRRIKL